MRPPLDVDRFLARADDARTRFATAEPYPHVVFDDFLDADAAGAIRDEFDRTRGDWIAYHHVNEWKRGFNRLAGMGPTTQAAIAALHSPGFLAALERLSGIEPLLADPDLDGGGLHETLAGGYLNVHADFLSHTTRPTWSRQLNLLLYLNDGWTEAHRGWLELWDAGVRRCAQRIEPVFNRCVVFRTSPTSFHGVPAGVAGPPRRSLALYYFRDEGRACALRPTRYVPLPGDPLPKRALMRADGWALHVYSWLKRHAGVRDGVASRLLRRF